ncbi:hypothetical protein [Asaia prunellae]|uniref:hypothetical protein n=1 Tax=Asaia prunellae TaxID=610245 RepID=UPI00047153F7|nr:hypothetical protein [Asaia prunellae]
MRAEDAKVGVRVRLLKGRDPVSSGEIGVIQCNDGTDWRPLQVTFKGGTIWFDLGEVELAEGMRKEDVKVGMKVLVKSSTYMPTHITREMVGHIVEVKEAPDREGQVKLWTPGRTNWGYFNLSDIEPVEPPQVPSVTINGTVYVPEDTIKTPEPAPAPKFFWGQWVKVAGRTVPAIVVEPLANEAGDIKVIFAGHTTYQRRPARVCTPIGA